MFLTYRQTEIPAAGLLGEENTQMWRYVEQPIHTPWFYVNLMRKQDEGDSSCMLLIPSAAVLDRLIDELSDRIWLKDAMLVSPAYVNGTSGWKMERLVAVNVVVDSRDNGSTFAYEVEGDQIYLEDGVTEESNWIVTRVIFSAARHLRL